MNARALLIILAIIVLLAVGYLAYSRSERAEVPTDMATTTETGATAPTTTEDGSDAGVTVSYTDNGFSPATITVPVGTTVTWVNEGSRMWIGSDEHPTHTEYDGTAREEHCAGGAPTSGTVFDQCGAGDRFSFTFTKPGTWAYHNHANASDGGTVVVTE